MRVLVIGAGAREHALCWSLARSPQVSALYCAPGNGGTATLAENVPLDPMDFAACAEWAARNQIDLTVVGPDDPLGGGIVDVFALRGLCAFGPNAAAARIESSKTWAKRLMADAGVPTARSVAFTAHAAAVAYLDTYTRSGERFPVVVKASGLAAGKGVVIAHSPAEARAALDEFMLSHRLGAAGDETLIEEFLEGRELSLFAITDGATVLPFAPACDYKRAFDRDEGPNTGGMGAYSPPTFATPALLDDVRARILEPTVRALAAANAPFRGLLYAGLILTADGPYVLEFNARFGDPETQALLPRLQSSLLELMVAATRGDLAHVQPPRWSPDASCGVVLASEGYPGSYTTGHEITGLDVLDDDILAFHAGTRLTADGRLTTAGGRVLTLVALGPSVAAARERVYASVERVRFAGVRWRRDIGAREG
jgi:phosphoribosylamine--glycine ligase